MDPDETSTDSYNFFGDKQCPINDLVIYQQSIAQQIKTQRVLAGFTQEQLSQQIGVSFQQVQKYERAANRISACRLFQISLILSRPIEYFFQSNKGSKKLMDSKKEIYESDLMAQKETIELIKYYYAISDKKVRQKILELAKTLAKTENDEE